MCRKPYISWACGAEAALELRPQQVALAADHFTGFESRSTAAVHSAACANCVTCGTFKFLPGFMTCLIQ